MPRLYRDSPLNSIWEGSGNVTALDLLRALRRQPAAAGALTAELARRPARTGGWTTRPGRLAASLARLADAAGPDAEYAARRLAGLIALALQAALLVRHAPAAVADSVLRLPARYPGTPRRAGRGSRSARCPTGSR